MTPKKHVTLYTKPGCHLCEDAKQEIIRAGCADEYTFQEINIETSPELKARYGLEIPVVRIDGVVVFKYRLTADEFRKQLRKADFGLRNAD